MSRKRRTREHIQKRKKIFLPALFVLPIILSLIGLFFIFETSSVLTFRTFGDSFYYLKLQSMWFIFGVLVMIFLSRFDYRRLYFISFPLLLASIASLILVFFPGIGHSAGGARRWIDLGFVNFQPTEFVKFTSILYLSSWFLHKEKGRFFSYFSLLAGIIFLIILQPDMGTAVIVFSIFIILYFLSGQELRYLFFLVPFAAISFLVLVKTSPYRLKRFLAYFNPDADPLGATYHIKQILISLSGGGIFGRGIAASRQKYQFLPEAHTDSIFAIIGEEFGFLGSVLLIMVYVFFIYKAYQVATAAKDRYGQLLAGAIFSLFALQVVVNLGGMVNLFPLTGVPLPFISYGGSSLLVFFALTGVLLSIERRYRK